MKESRKQPAKKSYFFGKGYGDLWRTIKGSFRNIWKRTDELNNGYKTANFRSITGLAKRLSNSWAADHWFTTKIILSVFYLAALLSVATVGTIVTTIFSVFHIVVLLAFMLIIYLIFTMIWLLDRIYLLIKKISTVCPNCDENYLIPTYICPNCGAKHTRLMPGVYGIIRRKCECGYKLPTTFFNGRNKLEAECPHCGFNLGEGRTGVSGKQVCIPVVGGPRVGKTAFITAFSYDFIEVFAKRESLDIEMLNPSMDRLYSTLKQYYNTGNVERTIRKDDIHNVSSVDLSFKVNSKKIKPQRILHIYDISGEVFSDSLDSEVLRLYKFTHGLIIIIDPFSIPDVMVNYGDKLSHMDKNNISDADMSVIIDTFMNKLRESTGLADKDMAKIPVAVVINKVDSAGLFDEIGIPKAEIMQKINPNKFANLLDTEDYLCRKFLHENGMDNVLMLINNKFKVNRYFACSAIGHERESGMYEPIGVMTAMEWLIKETDSNGIGKIWKETEFTKKPFALKMDLAELGVEI